MVNVCVLIRVMPGKSDATLKAVKEVKGVKDAYLTFGRYDIIAFAEVKNLDEAARLATKLNSIEAIKSTETLIEVK